MKYLLYYISAVLFLTSCGNKKIEITSEYIINENWSKQGEQTGGNSIEINRMRLKKDSTIDLANLNQVDILNRLEKDSSFIYVANPKINSGEKYIGKKIYFNKDNGFYWWTQNGDSKTKVLGNLEKRCWYKFSELVPYYIYIYIDSLNNVHYQNVILSNY